MNRFRIHLFILLTGFLLGWMSCSRPYLKGNDHFNPTSIWTWGGGPERNGRGAEEVVPPLKLEWIYRADAGIERAIYAADSLLFFGDKGGDITILDQFEGKSVRSIRIQKRMGATCLPDGRHLIIALRWGKETLRSVNMTTGKKNWALQVGGIEGEPLLINDRIFVGNILGRVFAIGSDTGKVLWKRDLYQSIGSSFALSEDHLIITTEDGTVWALSAMDGVLLWKNVLLDPILSTPIVFEDRIFFGTQSGFFYCLDLSSGGIIWKTSCDGSIFKMAAAVGDAIHFGTSQGVLYSLDTTDGTVHWLFETDSVVGTAPLISGNTIYFGTLDKILYGLHRETGEEVWNFTTRGRIRTTPLVWNGMLIVASENYFVYGFIQE